MTAPLPTLSRPSPWLADFERQLDRRKHVILYGNVSDHFVWSERYWALKDLLFNYFLEEGFEILAGYAVPDSMLFADERSFKDEASRGTPAMRKKFEALMGKEKVQAADTPRKSSNAALADPTSPPRSQALEAIAPSETHAAPSDTRVFSHIRTALRQDTTTVAAFVELGDLLTGVPGQFAADERDALALLKDAMLGARRVKNGTKNKRRNSLIFSATDLARVPEWLYLDNPHVALVRVERPDRDERRQYAMNYTRPDASKRHKGFYGGDAITVEPELTQGQSESTSQLERFSHLFSELTDGMHSVDLQGLRTTSWSKEIPVSVNDLRALIDYYKFGHREDPWENLNIEAIRQAENTLKEGPHRVIGQDNAVKAVVSMLTRARVGLSLTGGNRSSTPRGVFFFVGPTGVGKTEMAKAMANLVFGDHHALVRFDMSEYKEEHAADRLAGAPPGFVGYEQGGQLTSTVLQRPHSILLFDEIDKAHPRVLDKFLQILEDGRLTDGKGQTAYFNHSAIIFTSNVGVTRRDDPESERARLGLRDRLGEMDLKTIDDQAPAYDVIESHFKDEVEHWFTVGIQRAELYNRLGDNIVVFDVLRPSHIRAIGRKFLDTLAESAKKKYDLTLTFAPHIYDVLAGEMAQGNNMDYGGRRIKARLEKLIERPLNQRILEDYKSLDQELPGLELYVNLDEAGALTLNRVTC